MPGDREEEQGQRPIAQARRIVLLECKRCPCDGALSNAVLIAKSFQHTFEGMTTRIHGSHCPNAIRRAIHEFSSDPSCTIIETLGCSVLPSEVALTCILDCLHGGRKADQKKAYKKSLDERRYY